MARPGMAAGAGHALKGFRLIFAPGVRVFVLVPLLINVVLFAAGLLAAGEFIDYLLAEKLAGMPEFLHTVLRVLFWVLAAITVFFTFSLVANLVASPFNGILAEAVERHLDPSASMPSFTWTRLLAEAVRSIAAELRKLVYIVVRALPLLVLTVIPGLNVVAPPLWILFGAWMLSLEYLDCPLGNHGRGFPAVIEEMRARRGLALGFGGTITILTMIPLLNFLAMPVGVAGATSLYVAHVGGTAPVRH